MSCEIVSETAKPPEQEFLSWQGLDKMKQNNNNKICDHDPRVEKCLAFLNRAQIKHSGQFVHFRPKAGSNAMLICSKVFTNKQNVQKISV